MLRRRFLRPHSVRAWLHGHDRANHTRHFLDRRKLFFRFGLVAPSLVKIFDRPMGSGIGEWNIFYISMCSQLPVRSTPSSCRQIHRHPHVHGPAFVRIERHMAEDKGKNYLATVFPKRTAEIDFKLAKHLHRSTIAFLSLVRRRRGSLVLSLLRRRIGKCGGRLSVLLFFC